MGTEDVSAIISHLTPVAHFPNFYDSLGTVKEVFRKGIPETITDSTVKTLVEDLQLPLIFLTLLTRRVRQLTNVPGLIALFLTENRSTETICSVPCL